MTPQLRHLRARARLLRQVRQFFDSRGYLEVQPPCLAGDCIVDPYIDPLSIDSRQLAISDRSLPSQYYLQTSPESAMKRMMCAGAPSIYSIGPVFRAGERGPFHNPEFSMLEWYELGGNARTAIDLLGRLSMECLDADRFETVSYRDAFLAACALDPLEAPDEALVEKASAVDHQLADSMRDDRDGMLDWLMDHYVVPTLGLDCPVVVTDYPLSQAALAKPSDDDPRCAARFELFVSGVELANGYDELQDAEVLRARAKQNNQKRTASGRTTLPIETNLAGAMDSGMPACSGVALGIDRLLMCVVEAKRIDAVLPFPIEIA